jgi:hypothetical protein
MKMTPSYDVGDAERWVKRLVAKELTLSFVPDPEQCSVERPETVRRERHDLRDQAVLDSKNTQRQARQVESPGRHT